MNDTLKWIALGVVGYLLYMEFTAGDLAASMTTAPGASPTPGAGTGTGTGTGTNTPATTGTTPGATAPVQPILLSQVTRVANNALQATFNINGVVEVIAVIPGGDAYNTAGHGITPALAAVGITPAQLYAIMNAQIAPGAPVGGGPITTAPGHGNNIGVRGLNALARGPLLNMRSDGTGKWVM